MPSGPGSSPASFNSKYRARASVEADLKALLAGKTSPRLWADLLYYDPLATGRNTLCELPPQYQSQNASTGFEAPHKHLWMLQSGHPKVSLPACYPPEPGYVYRADAICEECRRHLVVEVDLPRPNAFVSSICPSNGNPLHHLRYDPSRSRPVDSSYAQANPNERWEDKRVFACTAKECSTTVTVVVRPPILYPELARLLIDKNILRKRVERNMKVHPELYGGENVLLPPTKVLSTLASYLKNALNKDERPIPAENRRLLSCFGNDCNDILVRAHFEPKKVDGSIHWKPPPLSELTNNDSQVQGDLRDMYEEVIVLHDGCKDWTAVALRAKPQRVDNEIKNMLSFKDYDSLSNWSIDLTVSEHPHFAGLGATMDFSDNLLIWAYNRQRECDPEDAPYYLECLSGIASNRNSEALQIEVVTIKSRGEFASSDVEEAYKTLGVGVGVEDDLIISTFHSRLTEVPAQEAHFRDSLELIGKAKNSQALLDASRRTITDVSSAYSWFQIPEGGNLDDQYLITIYEQRVADVPSDEATAKDALKVIAESRQSNVLLSFLERGTAFDAPFSLDAAYERLGLNKDSEDSTVIAGFRIAIADIPARFQDFRFALKIIADARNSIELRHFLEYGQSGQELPVNQPPKGSADWPVGLENIGNTCYLNSLLQFYFTIKPLRNMVLDFESFQETDVTDEVVKRKRVGGRKVTRKEIERAKKFVSKLRTLFQSLISAEASYVKPERELAQLALFSSRDEAEEEVRRMSMVEPSQPVITVEDSDKMDIDSGSASVQEQGDDASDTTLVDEPMSIDVADSKAEGYIMIDGIEKPDNKENLPPPPEGAAAPKAQQRQALEDVSMKLDVGEDTEKRINALHAPPTPPPEYEQPQEQPPPVPPRPRRQSTEMDINIDARRQQDVTECIGNVMFQLEAAIKPQELDENGEQIDLIKKLFYGKTRQTLSFHNSAEMRTKEELFLNLIVNVVDGDRDIYDALDESFDLDEAIELEGREVKRFLSIRELPPILQIQVQRVQFDRERGAYKSDKMLNFHDTIFMDRYMDTEDHSLRARREASWEWKAELRALKSRRAELVGSESEVGAAIALEYTREWLEDVDDELSFERGVMVDLVNGADAIKRELEGIDTRIKDLERQITCQFTDLRKQGYRIHSVFIHNGTASGGHYWIYIYDFQKSIFRKYNDDHVDEVKDLNEVFTHANVQNPPTPYFLVYVREDQSLEITEAVRRQLDQHKVDRQAIVCLK